MLVFHYYAENAHWQTNYSDGSGIGVTLTTAQTTLRLFTGGKAGIGKMNLIQLQCSGLKYGAPSGTWGWPWLDMEMTTIPPSTMKVLGQSPGSDGNLWVAEPDNAGVELNLTAPGVKHYGAWVTPTKYPLAITANTVTLSNDAVVSGADFCVGQNVPFELSGLPGGVTATNFQWTFEGNYFNAQTNAVPGVAFPICSTVQYVDTNLLANIEATNWWVSGGTNPITYQASVSYTLIFTNGNPPLTNTTSGLFTMFRPQAKIVTVTGTPSVNSTWANLGPIGLSFGTTNVPGIVFSNTMPISSGNVYWVQIINNLHITEQLASDMHYYHASASGLDNMFPYPADPTNANWTEDSPGKGLTNAYLEVNILDEDFTMWFLFQHDSNSHYVPLRAVNWNWAASATNGVSGWVVESGTATNSVNPVDFETQVYPFWTSTVTNNQIPFYP